ncbi:hypothetical protein [Actinophytocola sp.]|uniref:hypothetical protein n=1 Tax=Actinophytocola sp. TaxID=1872138 RepID=UPI002D7FCF06|nr:hypothetical protein [Actinophytocola sp.]HET9138443.1 hypothetical protein [Actinophytocola sp.]
MNSPQTSNETTPQVAYVQAHYSSNRKLGHWTTARRIEVKAMRGSVVLDLRSPQIEDGDIEIDLLAERSIIKVLVPENAVVDHWDLNKVGRARVKDAPFEETPGGRRIKITGQLGHGELRIRRGGMAVLASMFTREYVDDVFKAHKAGTVPTLIDPGNTPLNTPAPARKK